MVERFMPATAYKPDPERNNIKDNMSLAYMHSLNATVNYALQENHRRYDNIGIDVSVTNKLLGIDRTVGSAANEIRIQLKAVSKSSTTMFQEDDHSITYTLKRPLEPIGIFYLVVVVLPEDDKLDTWRVCTPEMIILRKCAYFLPITLKAGKIKIPKRNILDPESYKSMFDIAKQKDAI
jgi:hypothetical protein